MQKILFPTDFSSCAERVYSHASNLAARYGADLHVLNVAWADAPPGNDPMGFIELEPEDDTTYSDAGLPVGDGVTLVHSRMTASSPVVGILEYASAHGIGLIVMATHGRTGIDHLLSGSVAEEVVRHAECPVLTVRCHERDVWTDQVRRILVPVDFSDSGPLPTALDLARGYGADVDVLHVIEEAVLPTIYGVEPLAPGVPLYLHRNEEALLKLLEGLPTDGLTINVHVRIGHPPRQIMEFAHEKASDLIVLASHGRTGLSRLLLGSVAEKVVRLADIPVFTCKIPAPAHA